MTRDPFTTLQLANPVTVEELSEPMASMAIRDLYEQIVEAPPAPLSVPVRQLRRRPGARRRRVVAVVLAGAATSLAWALYAVSREPTQRSSIACYAAADLRSWANVVADDGRPPLEVCAELWRRGVFGDATVPQLVACVIPSGAVVVVPVAGGDTCGAIGAANLAPPSTAAPHSSPAPPSMLDPATLTAALRSTIGTQECVDEAQAREIVQRELAARDLSWAIETQGPFTAERPCATVGVDSSEETVRLIPAPARR